MTDSVLMGTGVLNLTNKQAPGFEEQHFDRLMTLDKVAVAMYGYLYDELDDDEKTDLVVAHCLGLDVKHDPPPARARPRHHRFVPRSMRDTP